MPFPPQEQRPFTVSGVEALPSEQPGVYGIFCATSCIYIGQADDVKSKLLQHLRGQSHQAARILCHKPTYYLLMNARIGELDTRQAQLIRHYNPAAQYG